ncbi:hypothetical protein KVV02_004812 [Mortierella alpina]|uniref:AMP-activated protein kinase glycogen-binding domain-containing protein n=1 Tax=Mortierella alpina TaxID=64518 RepID=A0A9P7ZZZ3_MORAP|nr:hypothetical protein KVV02_004812 [Mortierella alpina]
MHQIRGQSLPKTFLENPYEKRSAGSSSSKTHSHKKTSKQSSSSSTHDPATKGKETEKEKEKEKEAAEDKAKSTKLKKSKSKKEEKGISSMIGASLMTTTMFLPPATGAAASPTAVASPVLIASASGRDRSSSLTSQKSAKSAIGATHKDEQQASTSGTPLTQGSSTITTTTTTTATTSALLPPLLPRNSLDNSSIHSVSSSVTHGHSHTHIRLPSIFKRRIQSSATSASLESSSSSTHSLALPSTSSSLKQQHPILMAPQQDITISWPYAVPKGQVFIAGTWSVPGHGPWEKIPMSLVPGTTDRYEVSLNVQEVEDISDYFDDDGYLHHELLEQHAASTTAATTTTTTTPSSPSTPGTTPHATLSKRQRIRRFFGRARSSSTTSNSATSNNNSNSANAKDDVLHQDLPYHHQSKDGIILPLSREYRYQYKFVIDDEWKCDPNRPQVQDSEGHWNHELAVELIEQIHQRPTASMLLDAVTNRSRSSSLHSQLTAPAVSKEEVGEDEGEAVKQDQAEIRQDHVEVLDQPEAETETVSREMHSPSPPPYSSPLVPLTAAAAVNKAIVSKPKVKAAKLSRNTYEAVLIFDEKDDVSDGEGGRVPGDEVDDDESDYDDDDELAAAQQQPSQEAEEVQQQQIVGDGDAAGVVTPQQDDDHGKAQPQHADNDQDAAILLSAAAATMVDDTVEDLLEQQARDEHEVESEPEVTASLESETVAVPKLPLDDAQEDHREDSFKLQAAANPEEQKSDSHEVASGDELKPEEELVSTRTLTKESSRAGLEVVTDNAAAAVLAASAATAAAAASYSQVPSPPLTPSKDHQEQHHHHHSETTLETEQTTETTTEQDTQQKSYVPLTPQSEAPPFKLTSTHEEDKTFDVLEDKENPSSIHLRSQSSSSLASVSSSSSKQKRKQDESVENKSATKKAGPDHFPNLIWSICKTTVVVSAAVVVLGFGLGRRRS